MRIFSVTSNRLCIRRFDASWMNIRPRYSTAGRTVPWNISWILGTRDEKGGEAEWDRSTKCIILATNIYYSSSFCLSYEREVHRLSPLFCFSTSVFLPHSFTMQLPLLPLALLPLVTSSPLLPSILHTLLPRDLTSTTQNDVVNSAPCRELTVIFARGTDSAGNVGSSTGPPFFQAIGALIGTNNIAVQGLDYPASIIGFLEGGSTAGGTLMANLTTQAMTQCPNTKVVVSGYRYVSLSESFNTWVVVEKLNSGLVKEGRRFIWLQSNSAQLLLLKSLQVFSIRFHSDKC